MVKADKSGTRVEPPGAQFSGTGIVLPIFGSGMEQNRAGPGSKSSLRLSDHSLATFHFKLTIMANSKSSREPSFNRKSNFENFYIFSEKRNTFIFSHKDKSGRAVATGRQWVNVNFKVWQESDRAASLGSNDSS